MRRVLFTLRAARTDSYFPVVAQVDYGVTCTNLVTTNGSFWFLAEVIVSRPGYYEVVEDLDVPLTDVDALAAWLREAYQKVKRDAYQDEEGNV